MAVPSRPRHRASLHLGVRRRPSTASLRMGLPGPAAPLQTCRLQRVMGARGTRPRPPRARHKGGHRKEENFPPPTPQPPPGASAA